jgi:hypothetical protein
MDDNQYIIDVSESKEIDLYSITSNAFFDHRDALSASESTKSLQKNEEAQT